MTSGEIDDAEYDDLSDLMESDEAEYKDFSYALSKTAKSEVHKAITDKNYQSEIKLTENSPSILTSQKGVRDLPMMMVASHVRQNVLTEAEAKRLGLSINPDDHYHGLGETLFLNVIADLDNVTLAYRGTKNAENPERRENYFLLISQIPDATGNIINVPVYINEKGVYNRVFIDTNKVATVFGRDGFKKYINEQLKSGNLVRIKNRSSQTSESTPLIDGDYSKIASKSIISNSNGFVNTKNKQSSVSKKSDSQKEGIFDNIPRAMLPTAETLSKKRVESNARLMYNDYDNSNDNNNFVLPKVAQDKQYSISDIFKRKDIDNGKEGQNILHDGRGGRASLSRSGERSSSLYRKAEDNQTKVGKRREYAKRIYSSGQSFQNVIKDYTYEEILKSAYNDNKLVLPRAAQDKLYSISDIFKRKDIDNGKEGQNILHDGRGGWQSLPRSREQGSRLFERAEKNQTEIGKRRAYAQRLRISERTIQKVIKDYTYEEIIKSAYNDNKLVLPRAVQDKQYSISDVFKRKGYNNEQRRKTDSSVRGRRDSLLHSGKQNQGIFRKSEKNEITHEDRQRFAKRVRDNNGYRRIVDEGS